MLLISAVLARLGFFKAVGFRRRHKLLPLFFISLRFELRMGMLLKFFSLLALMLLALMLIVLRLFFFERFGVSRRTFVFG